MMDDKDSNERQLDIPQEPTFLAYYRSLGECPTKTYRLFDRGDYYTLHGPNAESIAKSFLCTSSAIKYIGSDSMKIPSIAISMARYESLLKHILIERKERLEFYKKSTKKFSANDWQLDFKASAGCLGRLEDIIYSTNASIDSRGVCGIQLTNNLKVGVSLVDTIANEISFCEFEDNDYLSHLESLLVQISPKETIICTNDKQQPILKKLISILESNKILVTEVKKSTFNSSNLESDLDKLIVKTDDNNELSFNSILDKNLLAKESLSATFDYLNLLGDNSNFDSFHVKQMNLSQFVKLDATALNSLDLFCNDSNNIRSNRTLFQVLNYCRTFSGQRLLAQFIRQPLTDINKIEERLDIIEFFIKNCDIRQDLSEIYLKKIPDLSRIYKKLHSKRATLQDCYRIYQMLKLLPNFQSCLIREESVNCLAIKHNFSDKLKSICNDLSGLRKSLENVIDEERIETTGEFWIRSDYDDDLKELRTKLDKLESDANYIYKNVDKELMKVQNEDKSLVKLESSAQGFVFKLTRKNEKCLRNNDKYFEVKNSTKRDGFRFLNKQMKKLNNDYIDVRCDYEKLQNDLANDIIADTAKYSETIKELEILLTYLDVMVGLANASLVRSIPYIRPKLLPKGSGKIDVIGVRHPCLELQDNVSYIANDVSFDSKKHKFYFITGPNMGGKSTYIRSIALCVLMAQIGSYVPADSAVISLVDAIFTRVGAGDLQIKGISTFMAEMIETAAIFRSATEDSLVVIDELGRGTSTYDGFGLASAISEYLVTEIKSFTLFATHFHELTQMSKELTSIGNLHLSAVTIDKKLTFLYKVNNGVCDQSFGINVAQLANFPQLIIDYAKEKLKELEGLSLKSGSIEDVMKAIGDQLSNMDNIDADIVKQIINNKLKEIV
ncbi:DNA mismatch repair protein Msh2-like [Oppia nitens]|uniref:DNA mismatch repair protein Msh2-like n=1 Tax=Oppia nitens TaxID=1686743 RepID=UPI0023DC5857|nr:DNA mismatch repair protein Msh2-like [Oppia nitens]